MITTQMRFANALIFLVFEKACENDMIMMNIIWGKGIIWVNRLLNLLVRNDLQQTQLTSVETMNELIDRIEFKVSECAELVRIRVSNLEKFDVQLNEIKTALLTTYELVRKLKGIPCTSAELAARGVSYYWFIPRRINIDLLE